MIDLNCDMGESFGSYHMGQDACVMPWITSVNVACGYHAGDPLVMLTTLRLAKHHSVAIGAHPGYPDLQGFGRRNMDLTPDEIEAMVLYQVGALAGMARALGMELGHVKPHGALYNQAAQSAEIARAVARAVAKFSPTLVLVGLAGSHSIAAAVDAGLRVAQEAFPDRAYNSDGSLRSRRLAGAVMEDEDEVARHALELARDGIRLADSAIHVDTLCLHGDHPNAAENARRVRAALEGAGIVIHSLASFV